MDRCLKVLIADDHALVRNGLRQVLEMEKNLSIVEATDGEEALKAIRQERPQIAILDVEMPKMTGFDVARRVHQESLPTSIIFLTMYKEETVFNKAMDLGVKGYVLKENTVSEILLCVRAVCDGKYYLSPSISEYLVRRNAKLVTPASDRSGIDQLTPSELTILKLIASMKTNSEIADDLKISVKTVHNHRNNICEKLGLRGAHALLRFAIEQSSRL